jgi:hypothetical protein
VIIDRRVKHIHIPRTAGRSLIKIFKHSGYTLDHTSFNSLFLNQEINHLTNPHHQIFFNNSNFSEFAVVRHPIDKFLSALSNSNTISHEKKELILKNQESLDNFLDNIIVNGWSNWFTPQIDFICYKTKIWRFEDKFEDKFNKWLNKNFDLNINVSVSKDILQNLKLDDTFHLTNKQINFIKNYYYKDFKLLDY